MHFTKMHGLGNDYLYVYGEVPENIRDLSVRLSERHFGAGSDGMIYISPSETADFKMRIFNADGSEAKMCGNGIRCVGKYVYEKGYTDKKVLRIETLSGIRTLRLHTGSTGVKSVTVDMGAAAAEEEKTLFVRRPEAMSSVTGESSAEGGADVDGTDRIRVSYVPVSVGNPHAVIFVEDIERAPLTTLGPLIERHSAFPEGVNVEFVQVLSDRKLRMRVWERGSGVTMACGTGACASAAAAVRMGFCSRETPIAVVLDGGTLEVTILGNSTAMMDGPAAFVYEGETI